ncbi:hypothetical protein BDL97_17G094200 [Sphagnum fallax]|nr:hypothetical protein BDL97_17G094200 [Sphagnum fallax]KAH8936611.1 hypothetical protein BDL97_17G094200 [Sphagnum fallax]
MRTMDGNGGKQMMEVTRLKPTFLSDPYRSDSGMLKLFAGTQDVRVMEVQPTSVVLIHSVPRRIKGWQVLHFGGGPRYIQFPVLFMYSICDI